MDLRDKIELKEPRPIGEVIEWLSGLLERGFSDKALVKIGKSTGQKWVLLASEHRNGVSTEDQ